MSILAKRHRYTERCISRALSALIPEPSGATVFGLKYQQLRAISRMHSEAGSRCARKVRIWCPCHRPVPGKRFMVAAHIVPQCIGPVNASRFCGAS